MALDCDNSRWHMAAAYGRCTRCHGYGKCSGRNGHDRICDCVWRRVCRHCVHVAKVVSALAETCGPIQLEYAADVWLAAKRTLEGIEWTVFKLHMIEGADWKVCCARLAIERGAFFHLVYRIEMRLGRVFSKIEPYALYPIREYSWGQRGSKHEATIPSFRDSQNRTVSHGRVLPGWKGSWQTAFIHGSA